MVLSYCELFIPLLAFLQDYLKYPFVDDVIEQMIQKEKHEIRYGTLPYIHIEAGINMLCLAACLGCLGIESFLLLSTEKVRCNITTLRIYNAFRVKSVFLYSTQTPSSYLRQRKMIGFLARKGLR